MSKLFQLNAKKHLKICLTKKIVWKTQTGVGKTSLVHLIANNEALVSPGWTIGCSVDVKLHEYKEGTNAQQAFFIELFDVGGSISHQNTRGVFYNPINGIILVHDLTNRKSHDNLQRWLYEIINKDGKDVNRATGCDNEMDPEFFFGSTQVFRYIWHTKSRKDLQFVAFDLFSLVVWHFAILISLEHETFMNIATQKQIQFKSFQIPILVIGTKADMVDDKERIKELNRNGNIGEPANLD